MTLKEAGELLHAAVWAVFEPVARALGIYRPLDWYTWRQVRKELDPMDAEMRAEMRFRTILRCQMDGHQWIEDEDILDGVICRACGERKAALRITTD